MKPNVFVSSTCFDLSQIRTDLEETIIKIGFHPILSELNSFPVNPSEELLTNCVNTVSKNADILILIIGNRYGSKSESGKSITNIEYDTAKRLGIPIYVFIKKEILNYLDIWKSNKDADFSKQVDTKEIFEFVSQIREEDKIWSFEFDNAQEISSTFVSQIAFRFKELLDINRQLVDEKLLSFWYKISSKSKKILIQQGDMYELDFFRQVLSDEYEKLENIKLHYEYDILSACTTRIDNNDELLNWIQKELKSLFNFTKTFGTLINELFPKYYGEPGIPSNLNGLLLIAQSYAKLLGEILQWSLSVKNVSVPKEYEYLLVTFSKYLDDVIKTSLEFPLKLKMDIEEILERINRGEEKIKKTIVLKFSIDDEISERFRNELDKIFGIQLDDII